MLRVNITETAARWGAVSSDFEQSGSRSLIPELLANEYSSSCDRSGPHKAISEYSFA